MMQLLEQEAAKQIANLIPGKGKLVVGVSGGADSMALLYLLDAVLHDSKKRLVVVHVHHGLRSKAADRDLDLVRKTAEQLDVTFLAYNQDVAKLAKMKKQSLEEAGRYLRQTCFMDAARKSKSKAVVLAQHQDDQVETVMLNLMRGTGVDGLGGMDECRLFPHPKAPKHLLLIRPLLNISKKHLVQYLKKKKLLWREDSSNKDSQFTRNRIRQDIMPYLKKKMQTDVGERIVQTAASARRDAAFLEILAEQQVNKLCEMISEKQVTIKRSAFLKLDKALQWRFLSKVWTILKMPQKSVLHLQRILDAIVTRHEGLSLPGKWFLKADRTKITISQTEKKITYKKLNKVIRKNTRTIKSEKFNMTIDHLAHSIKPEKKKATESVCVDAATLQWPLHLRSLQAGDWMTPLGMKGKRKSVKKILSEMKLSSSDRDCWPLLAKGDEILWIYKGTLSDKVKVTSKTTAVVKFSISTKDH